MSFQVQPMKHCQVTDSFGIDKLRNRIIIILSPYMTISLTRIYHSHACFYTPATYAPIGCPLLCWELNPGSCACMVSPCSTTEPHPQPSGDSYEVLKLSVSASFCMHSPILCSSLNTEPLRFSHAALCNWRC